MRNFDELKQLLTQVERNDYYIPDGVDADALIDDMLMFIGHADSELRDKLIYSTFNTWGEKGIVSTVQMKHILDTSLDELHLFFGIGEKETDTVFTRSFSSLIVPIAFCMHKETPFLSDIDIKAVKDTLLRYVDQEKDFRGYVEGSGWAHAPAHVADALSYLISYVERGGMLEILDAVKKLVTASDKIYCAGEDERLSNVVLCAIHIGVCKHKILTSADIISWLDSFVSNKEWWKESPITDLALLTNANRRCFTKSLYFMLLHDKDINTPVKDEISGYLFDIINSEMP
jgi:hypothetical protein